MANSSDETNTINPDVSNVDGATQKSDTDNKIKNISNRIAKRSYRRRSDSQSSTNSVPMDEPMPEQSNENSMNSNRNNREVSKKKKSIQSYFFSRQFSIVRTIRCIIDNKLLRMMCCCCYCSFFCFICVGYT